MPGPIVSLAAFEQIVPEDCCPLWRNDIQLEKESGDT